MKTPYRYAVLVLVVSIATLLHSCGSGAPEATDPVTRTVPPPEATPTPVSQASDPLGEALDEYVSRNYPLFSGSVLVALQDQVLLSRGYKFADWELEVDNTPDTKFRIASITKPFTATAIMMLQDRGLLNVQDSVCDYLPDCPDGWGPITIHQLLTHTSGIPDYTSLPGALESAATPHTVTEIIVSFQGEPLEFTPGESFLYSNSGYILLGAVIEAVTKNTYDYFIRNDILRPHGLEDTGYDRATDVIKGRASGYNIDRNLFVNAQHLDMSNTYAAGGLYSTVEDLYRWEQILLNGELLSQDSLDLMLTPHVAAEQFGTDYGYGWLIADKDGRRMIGHSGKVPGFHTNFEFFPDDGVSIIVLSNIETADVDALTDGLETIVFEEP